MDFNEIEKAYAMGRAYAQGLKYAKLMAKLNTVAQDEDGFVTLTDKEGNSYVAQTNKEERERYESTGKKLSQVKKEEKKGSEKKPEKTTEKKPETKEKTDKEYRDEQSKQIQSLKEQKIKENPLKNEKMEKAVDKFNEETAEKFKNLKIKADQTKERFNQEQDFIRKFLDKKKIKDLSDNELKDLMKRCLKIESDMRNVMDELGDLKKESHSEFTEIVQSKTANKGRNYHYLKNLKYGTELGDFAFNQQGGYYPKSIMQRVGGDVYSALLDERNERWRMASDSADFIRIQTMLDDLLTDFDL